jgi:integrase
MLRTAREVAAKLATGEPGRWAVGDGAYLQIAKVANRRTGAWVFRFTLNGKARHMGLGSVKLLSLAEARDRARQARQLLLDGIDPIEARNAARLAARAEAAKGITFKQCASRYIKTQEAGWRNPKHRAQWRATLETYAFPYFGDLSVAAVDTGLVLKAVEPIWAVKPETASRVRGRIEAVLDWAMAHEYRQGENPARWRGHLDKLLPARQKVRAVKHHAALPWTDLPEFMEDLRDREGIAARALEFAILTAARTGEVIGAVWDEFDLAERLWTIPGERMKAGKPHRVPLNDCAVEILQPLPREVGNPFVFLGGRKGRALSNMALLKTLERMGRGDLTTHGFRSTFRDWASETTGYQSEVVEMALAHVVASKTEAAYRRGDLFEKRRRLMADWATYCASPQRRGDVVPLRRQG